MIRSLLGAVCMAAVVVLTSFAVKAPEAPARKAGAWKISDLQLDRAFRTPFTFPAGPPTGTSITLQMPPGGGVIITQLTGGAFGIAINGVTEPVYTVPSSGVYVPLDPPVIARPGDTVTIYGQPGSTAVAGGYTTLPGET